MNKKKAEVTEKKLTGEVEEDELSQFEIVNWLLNDKDIDAEIKRKLIDKILAQAKCKDDNHNTKDNTDRLKYR